MRHDLYNCWKLIRPSRIEHHIREGRLLFSRKVLWHHLLQKFLTVILMEAKGCLTPTAILLNIMVPQWIGLFAGSIRQTNWLQPLFAFDFTQWSQVVLFLVFYLTSGFLCIRHNCFSVNIILEVKNFRFYRCKIENEDGKFLEQRILSHRRLNGCVGETLYLKSLNNEYKLDIQQ